MRSYLVTFAFVLFRLVHDSLPTIAQCLGESENDGLANLTWISWLLPLAVIELIRQTEKSCKQDALFRYQRDSLLAQICQKSRLALLWTARRRELGLSHSKKTK